MKKGSSFIIIVIGICLLIASIVIMDSAENSDAAILRRQGHNYPASLQETEKLAGYMKIAGIVVSSLGALLLIVSAIEEKKK